ncbi:MAG: DUF63 family protein [Thermoplasmatota archaeon]
MDRRTRLELIVMGILISALIVVIVGCILFPDTFWDKFVWKYYWGPIVADAGGDAGDITPDYNWFDTLTYGIILAVSAYFIHRLFVKLDIRVGTGFFAAMSPVIVIGPAARVLEDMELFNEPLQYIFISPIIYIFLGLATFGTVFLAYFFETRGARGSIAAGVFLFLPGLIVSLVISSFPSWLNGNIPVYPFLLITIGVVILHRVLRSRRWETTVGLFWLQGMLFSGVMYAIWLLKGDWYDAYVAGNGGEEPTMHLLGGIGIIGLVILTTLIVMAGAKVAGKKNEKLLRLLIPVNGMIVIGHMTDASATFVGIDFFGYTEKHVVPSGLMKMLDSTGFPYPGIVMYPLKLAFLIPALYIMDISMEKESKENPHLLALVKLTVLVLGMGPGIRDLIRLSLGV